MRQQQTLCHAVAAIVVLAALLLPNQAHAARDCKSFQIDIWKADTARDAKQCLTELHERLDLRTCDSLPCIRIKAWRDLPSNELVGGSSALVKTIRDELNAEAEMGFVEARPVLKQIDGFLARLRHVTPAQLSATASAALAIGQVSTWSHDANGTVLAGHEGETRLATILDVECGATPSRCNRALIGSARTLLTVWQIEVVGNTFLKEKRDAFVAHVSMLDERWKTYFAGAHFQYPWELALNSAKFGRDMGTQGLVGPPSEQWILMHPSVGLRYRRQAESAYDSALVLELVGYQKWTWVGSEMTGVLGGAVVAAWTDQTKRERPALGLVLHLRNNYSVGLLHDSSGAGKKFSLVLSADLGKLFQDPKALKDRLLGP